MRVKLFVHSDLDGVGCATLLGLVYGHDSKDVRYCNYKTINDEVKTFLTGDKVKNYDKVFITDISINEEVAELINNEFSTLVTLIDHHETAKWLNKYNWATIEELEPGVKNVKTCATSMVNRYLHERNLYDDCDWNMIAIFTESVRRFDTWDWEKMNDMQSKRLNQLLYIIGFNGFIREYIMRIKTEEKLISNFHSQILDLKDAEYDVFLKRKLKELHVKNMFGYNVGIVFAETSVSELCNSIAKERYDLDMVISINMSTQTVSYRTNKSNVDVQKIAMMFGGGGHTSASGSQIKEGIVENLILDIFKI